MAIKTVIINGRGVRGEATATNAITPGDLIEWTTTADEVQRHSTAAGTALRMFAVENEVVGKDIDDDYADNDNVLFEVCSPGQRVFALVTNGTAAIAVGDFLESSGDGKVRTVATSAATADTSRASVVGVALEAVDNSGGSAPVRIKIMVV